MREQSIAAESGLVNRKMHENEKNLQKVVGRDIFELTNERYEGIIQRV